MSLTHTLRKFHCAKIWKDSKLAFVQIASFEFPLINLYLLNHKVYKSIHTYLNMHMHTHTHTHTLLLTILLLLYLLHSIIIHTHPYIFEYAYAQTHTHNKKQ